MRIVTRVLSACLAILLLGAWAAAAEGFSFSVLQSADDPAPASLADLPYAARLSQVPVFEAREDGLALLLTASGGLPEDVRASVTAADESPAEARITDAGELLLSFLTEYGWLRLRWTEGDIQYDARYLVQRGESCALWEASASADDWTLTLNVLTGGYTLSMVLDHVTRTELYYREDGQLQSAILMGDTREEGTLPLTVQYDGYGHAVSITAADLQSGYTFNRALGRWLNELNKPVDSELLPAFSLDLHPAPAALPLTYGSLYAREENAGIDRAALLASAPAVSGVEAGEGRITFESDADEAALTVDGTWTYDSRLGSLARDGNVFTALAEDLTEESALTLTLTRGGVTAVYDKDGLVSVTDRQAGVRWTADERITLTNGAATATYTQKGALATVSVRSADGAQLTYNGRGDLVGWELDGYIWTKDGGWKSTALNEKGNVIHPSAEKPAWVKLSSYPSLTILTE